MEPHKLTQVIDKLNEFDVGPWKPLIVTVEELPISAPIGSSKKTAQIQGHEHWSFLQKVSGCSCNFDYNFPTSYKKRTMGDVLAAKDAKQGRPSQLRST